MRTENRILFATRAYAPMAEEICRQGGITRGDLEVETFPDGERYIRIKTPVAGADVVVLGGTVSDTDTMELYDIASGAVFYGASRLTIAIPFFGYGTMERVIEHGEVVTAKTRACVLSSIPAASLGNRVVLLDLHSGGIPHYFEGALRPDHITARPLVVETIKKLGLGDFVMACTDAGRAKWVQNLANDLGVSASFVFKKRVSGSRTEVIAMNADVKGKAVVIYDDMIRSGSSLIKAAKAYKSAGAADIVAIATHGILPGSALAEIRGSGLFREVWVTDSHPRARELADGFLRVMPVAGLLGRHLAE